MIQHYISFRFSCELSCSPGLYGKGCSGICKCITNNTVGCDHVNGKCTCAVGWSGQNCETPCKFIILVIPIIQQMDPFRNNKISRTVLLRICSLFCPFILLQIELDEHLALEVFIMHFNPLYGLLDFCEHFRCWLHISQLTHI